MYTTSSAVDTPAHILVFIGAVQTMFNAVTQSQRIVQASQRFVGVILKIGEASMTPVYVDLLKE